MIEHTLTQEDLDNNPDLVTEGLTVGETVEYDEDGEEDISINHKIEILKLAIQIAQSDTSSRGKGLLDSVVINYYNLFSALGK